MKITLQDINRPCVWEAFDGNVYPGTIISVHKGIVGLTYNIAGIGEFLTYLTPNDQTRILLLQGKAHHVET